MSRAWTNRFIKNIEDYCGFLKPENQHSVLEIGVHSGLTARYFGNRFLQHPGSVYVGIDPWEVEVLHNKWRHHPDIANIVKKRYDNSMKVRDEFAPKMTMIQGYSAPELMKLRQQGKKFDFIYVDGDHAAYAVNEDSVLAWGLLEIGGVMVWDDYGFKTYTKFAVDNFFEYIQNEAKLLFQTTQFGVVKTEVTRPKMRWRKQHARLQAMRMAD